jgi:hypothetical protein
MKWFLLLLLSLLHGCHYTRHNDYHDGKADKGAATMQDMMNAPASSGMEDFCSRMQTALDDVFSTQNESYAMWIALSHPKFSNQYFVFGNAPLSSLGHPPDIPMTLDDSFQIGLISKTFLGMAMLLLEERGHMPLNNTIGKLVPDFARQFNEFFLRGKSPNHHTWPVAVPATDARLVTEPLTIVSEPHQCTTAIYYRCPNN